jgi:enoyl-CoA hydratase
MPITTTIAQGVGLVRMSMPSGNTIDHAFCEALGRAIDELEGSGCGAAVLAAEGAIFSVGLNLPEIFTYDRAAMGAFVTAFDGAFERLFGLAVPLVAAVNGHAIAGGAILAFCADERIMAPGGGQVGVVETTLGLPFPAAALEVTRAAVPPPRWTEVIVEGRRLSAEQALAAGLVQRLEAGVEQAALERAAALARLPRRAVARVKADLRAPVLERIAATRALMRERFLDAWFEPEVRESIGQIRAQLLARRSRTP